ncbi:right-handed parallel beta-helix repeat-containing protein, partial [uncultured Arthrobacter sp.]|uniref:right-handed parallel beta-helix repeat-containing protein n=1 Tax=uncultured Arthrobacter sp. TaxID=114050 RepID=UPI003218093B
GGSGISVDGNVWKESRPTNTIIEDVVSHHNDWQGVTTYGALGVRVVRAKTHDNERHGLNSEWSDDVTFEDCETFANGRRGVRIAGRSRGVQLLNVRSYDNGADNPNGGEILIGMQVFPLANPETGEMVNGFPENVQVVDSELLPARGRPHIQMDAGTEDAAAIEPLKSRLNLESPGAKNWTIQAFDVAGASRGAANKRAADREVTPALAEDSALAEEQ